MRYISYAELKNRIDRIKWEKKLEEYRKKQEEEKKENE